MHLCVCVCVCVSAGVELTGSYDVLDMKNSLIVLISCVVDVEGEFVP